MIMILGRKIVQGYLSNKTTLAVSIEKLGAASEGFVEYGISQHELLDYSILPKANMLINFSVLKHLLRSTQ